MKIKEIRDKCHKEWDAEDGCLGWERISHYLQLAYKEGRGAK